MGLEENILAFAKRLAKKYLNSQYLTVSEKVNSAGLVGIISGKSLQTYLETFF